MKQNNRKSKAAEYTIFEELELLQQYFSANAQCFALTTNQHKHQHKQNFSKTNRAGPIRFAEIWLMMMLILICFERKTLYVRQKALLKPEYIIF